MHSIPRSRLAVLIPLALSLQACSDSVTAPAEPEDEPVPEAVPTVVLIPSASISGFDADLFTVSCRATLDGAGACPIVRWDGVDYVGLSYRDNRVSLAVHAFGAGGAVLGVGEFPGTRYLEDAVIDTIARTASLVGQGSTTITASWDELRALW